MPELSEPEARALARAIVSTTNGVRIGFGRTNGRRCLHLIVDQAESVTGHAYSDTIYTATAWDRHPQNKSNRRRARTGLNDFIASQGVPA